MSSTSNYISASGFPAIMLFAVSTAALGQTEPKSMKFEGAPSQTGTGALRCVPNETVELGLRAVDGNLNRTLVQEYAPQARSTNENVVVARVSDNAASTVNVLCVGDGVAWITVEAAGLRADMPVLVGTGRRMASPKGPHPELAGVASSAGASVARALPGAPPTAVTSNPAQLPITVRPATSPVALPITVRPATSPVALPITVRPATSPVALPITVRPAATPITTAIGTAPTSGTTATSGTTTATAPAIADKDPPTTTATSRALPAGAAPTGVTASAVPGGDVSVRWTPAAGAEGHLVEQALAASGPFEPASESVSGGAITLRGVRPGSRYFRVVATYVDKLEGASTPVAVLVPDPPQPTDFKAISWYGMNVLNWKPAPGATGYQLARASWDPVKAAFIQGSDLNIPKGPVLDAAGLIVDTTFTDRSVTAGTSYVYWLGTYYKSSSGDFYFPTGQPPSVSVTPRDPAGMSWLPSDWKEPVKGGTATIAGVMLQVKWEPKPSALGYHVTQVNNGVTGSPEKGIPPPIGCYMYDEQAVDPMEWKGRTFPELVTAFPDPQFDYKLQRTLYQIGGKWDFNPTSYCFAVRAIYPGLDPGTNSLTIGGGRAVFSDPFVVRVVNGYKHEEERFGWIWGVGNWRTIDPYP